MKERLENAIETEAEYYYDFDQQNIPTNLSCYSL